MLRGFRCRCPACGEGKLFRAFLKVDDTCRACGEELHHIVPTTFRLTSSS
jgi:uncharacterized protein (DUF983 family)